MGAISKGLCPAKMIILNDIKAISKIDKTVVTQGTFDGLHPGHLSIVNQVVTEAKSRKEKSLLITFYPHPKLVLYPDNNRLKLLTTLNERTQILEKAGLDYLLILPFTKELSQLSPLEYIRNILVEKLNVSKLIIGYDHRFGKNREGSFADLQDYTDMFDFELEEIPVKLMNDVAVSSTKIRNHLLNGNVEIAQELMDRPYCLLGKIIKGNGNGKKMKFPTANIGDLDKYKLIPAIGVYAVKVKINDKSYNGMCNIGYNPTVNNKHLSVEVHIFNFKEDIYGLNLRLYFYKKIREEKKFDGIESLKEQLQNDKHEIETYFTFL